MVGGSGGSAGMAGGVDSHESESAAKPTKHSLQIDLVSFVTGLVYTLHIVTLRILEFYVLTGLLALKTNVNTVVPESLEHHKTFWNSSFYKLKIKSLREANIF